MPSPFYHINQRWQINGKTVEIIGFIFECGKVVEYQLLIENVKYKCSANKFENEKKTQI
jgi:hypothetical protein